MSHESNIQYPKQNAENKQEVKVFDIHQPTSAVFQFEQKETRNPRKLIDPNQRQTAKHNESCKTLDSHKYSFLFLTKIVL